ncbi:MAG: MATE family efflux transporter [Pseudomonadota bacterium]
MTNHSDSQHPDSSFALLRTALPIGAFYLTEILVGLTDLAVVGALGTTELAAVGLGKTIILSVMVVGFAVLSIGTIQMAERPTAARCGAVVVASGIVALAFVAAAILTAQVSPSILSKSGYDTEFVGAFESYTHILTWAIASTLCIGILKNVLNALQTTGLITWLSISIILGNLVTSIAFVHGVGFWQGLGVAGAAWATLLVNAIAAGVLSLIVLRSGALRVAGLYARRIWFLAFEALRLGWAAGAQQALESVLFIAVLYLLGVHSTIWLAAGAVVFAVMEVNYAASAALGEVLAARVAARCKEGRAPVRRLLRLGGGLACANAIMLGLTISFFSDATVTLFSSTQTADAARDLMMSLLRWTAPFFIFDALQIVYVHALRGLRQTVRPMVLSTSCYWLVGLGGGMVLAGPAALDATGVWIGFRAGLSSASLLMTALAFRAARQVGP